MPPDKVEFRDFVFAVWTYCSLDRPALESLVFRLYDQDSCGSITLETVVQIMHDVHGADKSKEALRYGDWNLLSGNILRALEYIQSRLQKNAAKGVRYESLGWTDWVRLLRRLPTILYPVCFSLMDAMRRRTCSTCRWQHLTRLRRAYSRNKLLLVPTFIAIVTISFLDNSRKITC